MNEFKLPLKYNWELASKPIVETCTEQPVRTGIYDLYPFPVTPAMVSTCTKIIDTPAFPTMFPVGSLVGHKVVGAYDLAADGSTFIIEYIGTVETTDGSNLYLYPDKTSGSVTAYPSWPGPSPVISAFANGASVSDNLDALVPAELMNIAVDQYAADAVDLYIVVASSTADTSLTGFAAFEFEFLVPEATNIKFTLY
jgi:hypothetical protein